MVKVRGNSGYDKRYGREETLPPSTIFKFIYGDLIESLLLLLTKLAGHSVTSRQAEVVVNGIKGHIDADIDGVTVDVKSASVHGFRKFADGTLAENDSFGYVCRANLQATATLAIRMGLSLAADKQNGFIAYLPVSREELKAHVNVPERIRNTSRVLLESEDVPERCYSSDEEEGKSGNRKLSVNCSYCAHKFRCWSDANGGIGLRSFAYSSGPVFLTKVVREPQVRETTF